MHHYIMLMLILWVFCPLTFRMNAQPPDTPEQIAQLGRGTADTLDWHPAGDVLAVGSRTGLWLYDENLADLAHFDEVGEVHRLAWSPVANRIATLRLDGTFQVWNVTLEPYMLSLHKSWSYTVEGEYRVLQMAWAPEGDRLAVIAGGTAHVLDIVTGDVVIEIPDLNYAVSWHPDGTQIAGTVDLGDEIGEQVRVWDANTGEVINTYTGIDPYLFWNNVQWSPDGSTLVGLTSGLGALHVWNVETGDLINDVDAFAVEFAAYFDMWWADDGERLITIARNVSPPGNSFLNVWDTTDWIIEGQAVSFGDVRSIAKHPNADTWALLRSDSQIVTSGFAEAEPLHIQSLHRQPPQIIAWSPDNQHLATARNFGQAIHVWQMTSVLETQERVLTIPFPFLRLDELRWYQDSNIIRGMLSLPQITAPGLYSTAFIFEWDAQTGETLGTIHETPAHITVDGVDSTLVFHTWNHDFTQVATETSSETITISTVYSNELGRIFPGEMIANIELVEHEHPTEIVWSPDNTMLVVITRDPQGETSAWVYDTETGDPINRLRPSFSTALYDISWSSDSSMVALVGWRDIAGSGETEYRLDVLGIEPLEEYAAHVMSVLDTGKRFYHAWHPGGDSIAVTTSAGISIYAVQNIPVGDDISPLTIIPDIQATAIDWSLDGSYLAGAGEDGTTRIWDMQLLDE